MHFLPGSHNRKYLALISIFVLLLNACSWTLLNNPFFNSPTSTPAAPPGPTATPQPSAAITFSIALPSPLLQGETLYLSVVDEITGLGWNPVNYAMQGMDTLHFTVTIPFAMYSVVKYRYMRQSNLPILEDDSADKAVRYRMYYVTGPGTVQDIVSSWTDGPFSGSSGRLSGQVLDSGNHGPIPNILIAVGGQQVLTDSGGHFAVENLPVGTHNLVAYAIDGAYQTFQQGATVVAAKSTPITLSLTPAAMVQVIFNVSVPQNTIPNAPLRFAGNLYQFGNTFGDLLGGLSSVSTRMQVLTQGADGKYSLSLMLPVGADIRYKYSLGDGFWNAEHLADDSFAVRQLIVPTGPSPIQVQDAIQTWQAGPSAPILFEVTVPAETPVTDIVSIQFNSIGWTEPIPMWPRGNNQWVYQLYSPINMLGDFQYRYCRNDQCGVADDVATADGHAGRPVSTSLVAEDLQDTVTGWTWYQTTAAASLVGYPVTARPAGFWAGVEFIPDYDPTWQAWMPLAIQNIQGQYANWLVLTPSWTVSRTSPFVFGPVPGVDPLWADDLDTISRARAANMSVAIFPFPNLGTDATSWWNTAPRDTAWWDSWFARYQAFADYHADLATKTGAGALILGGEWVAPALPGNTGAAADADTRWSSLLTEARQHYSGAIYWATAFPADLQAIPAFVYNLDGVYLLWYAPLNGGDVEALRVAAGQLLDSQVQPFQAALGKPVVIAAALPSTTASLPSSTIFLPGAAQAAVDLTAQVNAYQALIAAVNERAWIGGFVSRGYYPPAALQDASASIHGKPAADVLWYWYPRLLGITH